MTVERVKEIRRAESARAAEILGAEMREKLKQLGVEYVDEAQ